MHLLVDLLTLPLIPTMWMVLVSLTEVIQENTSGLWFVLLVKLFPNSGRTGSVHIPPTPTFVENDYFCDTGSQGQAQSDRFYGDDPLWDGAGCGPLNTCCTFNNPPWFYKELPESTTDDIEMRVCVDEAHTNENIAVEKIDIYML